MCMHVISICMYCMYSTTRAFNHSGKSPPRPRNTLVRPRTQRDPIRASTHLHFILPSPTSDFAHPPRAIHFPGPLWPLASSCAAGEQPLRAVPTSIVSQALSQPIWDGSAVLAPPHLAELGLTVPQRPLQTVTGWRVYGHDQTAPKHRVGAPHLVGPTQAIPGHVPGHMQTKGIHAQGIHVFGPSRSHSRTRFCASMRQFYV